MLHVSLLQGTWPQQAVHSCGVGSTVLKLFAAACAACCAERLADLASSVRPPRLKADPIASRSCPSRASRLPPPPPSLAPLPAHEGPASKCHILNRCLDFELGDVHLCTDIKL